MSERTVIVWGKSYTVSVYKDCAYKSVWHAVGDYEGRSIRTKDRSESAALKRWREAANYRGNG